MSPHYPSVLYILAVDSLPFYPHFTLCQMCHHYFVIRIPVSLRLLSAPGDADG